MQIIDINSLDQGQVYMMYSAYKTIVENLENKADKSENDEKKLKIVNAQLIAIEEWSRQKMNEKLHWTKEELLLNYGNNPSLIVQFHVGSKNFKKYSTDTAIVLQFTEPELLEMLENIHNKAERKSGKVKFKVTRDGTEGEMETREIFEVGGRRI
jgi:hypothetical protein